MRNFVMLTVSAMMFSACSAELKSQYTIMRYSECSAYYDVGSRNFTNSVQQAIHQVGAMMFSAAKVSAEKIYPKDQALAYVTKEKEQQLKRMEELFARQDSAQVKDIGKRCEELGNKLTAAIGAKTGSGI